MCRDGGRLGEVWREQPACTRSGNTDVTTRRGIFHGQPSGEIVTPRVPKEGRGQTRNVPTGSLGSVWSVSPGLGSIQESEAAVRPFSATCMKGL